jgi:hypothetical protein
MSEPLVCRRCRGELVPSFLPRFLRHVEKPAQPHYANPFLSPSSPGSGSSPSGPLSEAEVSLTGRGEAVTSAGRAQPVHS